MLVVTVCGQYTKENFLHLFKVAEKCKVVITKCSSAFEENFFYVCAIVETNWATDDKFIANLERHKSLKVEIVSVLDSDSNVAVEWTAYELTFDLPSSNSSDLYAIIDEMTKHGNKIVLLDIRPLITQITFKIISNVHVIWAVKGGTEKAAERVDEIVALAHALYIPINFNLY